ncbi:MAG: hypothetical protein NC132_05890 [Corallococcus sp.]|nr:hypothetical protein [Corallococcus sp.]MCM1360061.1 hypothetical protein [Corallococcus sp.]MCM1395618.1 hypothetical protein [Corallococcus sp.]
MSKKKLLTIILPCVAVVVLVAVFLIVYFCCFASGLYSELSKIANGSHDNISVKITTEQDGYTLISTFDVKNGNDRSVVNYSVQNFAPIDPSTGASGGDTVTSVGTVVLSSGKVLEQTGDAVDINFGNVTKLTLHFAERNFSNVKTENGIFTAKVTNPTAFMDAPSLQCTDMTVTFDYEGNAEHVIIVRYVSAGGAAVTLTYMLS